MPSYYEDPLEQELEKGIQQHKDTTQTAQNVLKVAEETRQVGANTLQELDEQGKQIKRIADENDEVQANLNIGNKVATQLGCWGWLNCFTGSDQANSKQLRAQQNKQKIAQQMAKEEAKMQKNMTEEERQRGVNATQAQSRLANGADGANGGRRRPPPRSQVGNLEGEQQKILDRETEEQDHILDQVGVVVSELRDQAVTMNTTLNDQDSDLNRLNHGIEDSNAQAAKLNKKIRRVR